jgi:Flp pilus assembly protein TadG
MLHHHTGSYRRGAALLEAAIVLPLMIAMIGIAADYSRIVYSTVTLSGSARNAALYEFDPYSFQESNYSSYSNAAGADATNLTNVTYSMSSATTNGVPTVTVNANYTFQTIARWFVLPAQKNVTRTVVIRQAQLVPD